MTMTTALLAWITAHPLLAIAMWFGVVMTVFPWFELRNNLRSEHL